MASELADLLKEDILSLGIRADAARRVTGEAVVQYQRVHVVPFADVRDGFVVPDAASELRLMGTPASLTEAVQVVTLARAAAGTRLLSAFSTADIVERCQAGWGSVPAVAQQLADVGLQDVAEAPVDVHPQPLDVVRAFRSGHLLLRRLTVANPLGDSKVTVFDRVRACVQAAGVERVAPLPRNVPLDKPTTGYEDLRVVALARLALSVSSGPRTFIEVDWTLYGPKLAQVALTFGADFLDAVPATNDEQLGRRRATVEDVERNIRAAGFEPREARPVA